ncbi:hypothetical protein [Xanthomonas albilineans]|nr:hypothetical protein [Xanthomonas albilineans]
MVAANWYALRIGTGQRRFGFPNQVCAVERLPSKHDVATLSLASPGA